MQRGCFEPRTTWHKWRVLRHCARPALFLANSLMHHNIFLLPHSNIGAYSAMVRRRWNWLRLVPESNGSSEYPQQQKMSSENCTMNTVAICRRGQQSGCYFVFSLTFFFLLVFFSIQGKSSSQSHIRKSRVYRTSGFKGCHKPGTPNTNQIAHRNRLKGERKIKTSINRQNKPTLAF